MKRSERRLLEEKLRYVAMEDIELDPEREQQMLEQVKAQFLRQDTEKTMKRSGGHGIGRRVLVVSAAAVLFIVLSFGFTVLMPESVSHARGFMRTAAIWVNNTLHLGYEFEEPMENSGKLTLPDAVYNSFEEAAASIPYPLVYLDNSSLEFQSVAVQNTSGFSEIVIAYQKGSQECYIRLNHAADKTLTGSNSNAYTIVPWQHGELGCWEGALANFALTYYSGMEITIRGINISYDDFLTLCQALKAIT